MICLLAAGCASGETDSSSIVSHESKAESTPDSSETQSTSDPDVSDVSDVSDPDEKPLWDTTPKNIEYTAHGYWGKLKNLRDGIAIRNTDELQKITALYAYNTESFTEYLSEFNDDFFREKALIAVNASAPSGSHELEVVGLSIDENGILATVVERVTPEGTDDYQERIFLLEVKKDDIGECNKIKVEKTEKRLYVGGSHSKYDTTPRDVEYELKVFSEYHPKCKTELDENGKPKFSSEWSTDLLFANSDLDKAKNYGIKTESIKDYKKSLKIDYYIDYDYTQMLIYVSSDNGNSVFDVSGVRADESGMTVTVTHDIAEGDNGLDRSYHMLLLTIPREQVAGCDEYRIDFVDNSGSFAPTNVAPEGINEPETIYNITVVDAETGKPIPSAYTRINAKTFSADENGVINVVCDYYESYGDRCTVTAYGYQSKAAVFNEKNGNEITVELTPDDYYQYTVTVVDIETGEPIKDAVISLYHNLYQSVEQQFFTDENGVAVITDYGALGRYLNVTSEEYPLFCYFKTDGSQQYTVKLGRFDCDPKSEW